MEQDAPASLTSKDATEFFSSLTKKTDSLQAVVIALEQNVQALLAHQTQSAPSNGAVPLVIPPTTPAIASLGSPLVQSPSIPMLPLQAAAPVPIAESRHAKEAQFREFLVQLRAADDERDAREMRYRRAFGLI